jgi:hypothetical protein
VLIPLNYAPIGQFHWVPGGDQLSPARLNIVDITSGPPIPEVKFPNGILQTEIDILLNGDETKVLIPLNYSSGLFHYVPGGDQMSPARLKIVDISAASIDTVLFADGILQVGVDAAGSGSIFGDIFDVDADFPQGNREDMLPDFGDAPDPIKAVAGKYPSLLNNNGAYHEDYLHEWLGEAVDGEADSIQIDMDLYDDGVKYSGPFVPDVPITVSVYVNTAGDAHRYDGNYNTKRLYLNAWADWNGDGVWDHDQTGVIPPIRGGGLPNIHTWPIVGADPAPSGEYILYWTGTPTTDVLFSDNFVGGFAWPGHHPNGIRLDFRITPPPTMTESIFYLRYRLDYGEDVGFVHNMSTALAWDEGNALYGEVEDHESKNKYDFGDAPDNNCGVTFMTYPSCLASTGARHFDFSKEWLGASVDGERESKQVNMDQFDNGVVFQARLAPNVNIPILVGVSVADNNPARYNQANAANRLYLNAWIDWNGDFDWNDAGEHVIQRAIDPRVDFPGGNNKVYAFNNVNCPAPPFVLGADIYARFRLDYGENVGPTGDAQFGEVEDYELVRNGQTTLITLVSFTATEQEAMILLEWETASEIDNAGFNIWRSETADGETIKINDQLIPAKGGATFEFNYSYEDVDVESDYTYYYKLEDIDNNGVSKFHDETGPVVAGLLSGTESDTGSSGDGGNCFIDTAVH